MGVSRVQSFLLIGTVVLLVASCSSLNLQYSVWDPLRYTNTCEAKWTVKKDWTLSWFTVISNGKNLADAVQEFVMTSTINFNKVIVGTAPWMALLLLGVIWLIAAIVFATFVCKAVRKAWSKCTGCCKRRSRKELAKAKPCHVFGFSAAAAVIIVALIASAVCAFIWSDYYRNQYELMRCNVWNTVKRSMLGTASETQTQLVDFVGFIEMENYLQKIEDIVNNSSNSTVLQKVNKIDFRFFGANDMDVLFRSVQRALQAEEYKHYCVGCLPEFIKQANQTLTEAEGLAGALGPKVLDLFAEDPSRTLNLTEFLTAFVVGFQQFVRSIRGAAWAGNLFVDGVFILSIGLGVTAIIAAILLCWGVGEIATDYAKKRTPSKRSQRLFGFLYSFYGFLGAIALFFIGSILMLGGYSNGGCYFINNNLREATVWFKLFGGTPFGKTVRQCVVLKRANMFLQEQEDSLDQLKTAFGQLQAGIEAIKMGYVQQSTAVLGKLSAISTVFPDYSWIVVPDPASLPADVFPDVVMSSLDVEDHDVSCGAVDLKYKSPLATACGITTTTTVAATVAAATPKAVKIYGLESLNKAINDNSDAKNWCLESVLRHNPSAVGCAAASPQMITVSSKKTDKNIIDEYNAIKLTDPAKALGWLHAVGVAVQKEKLLADRIFACGNLGGCSASEYMPYVTVANATDSRFVQDTQSRIELMQKTYQKKVDATAAKMDTITAAIQKDGVDAIENSAKMANCRIINDAYRLLSEDLCNRFLPSISVLPIATFLLVLASALGTPLLWIIYYYIFDLRKEGNRDHNADDIFGDAELTNRGDSIDSAPVEAPQTPAAPPQPVVVLHDSTQ